MYNCSLYFPQTALFTQPPSVFLKCENIDEERLIAEAEAVIDRNEALIKSTVGCFFTSFFNVLLLATRFMVEHLYKHFNVSTIGRWTGV